MSELPRIIIVMGVSGCGKTTIGAFIADKLNVSFTEGDRYHPARNVEKMRNGRPLEDEDRWPWLESLSKALHKQAEENGCAIAACSALKRSYRDYITKMAGEPVYFVHLDVSREELERRVGEREHEYMPASLLDSQLATLEMLSPDERGVTINADGSEDDTFRLASKALNL